MCPSDLAELPLTGVRVVDLTRILAGPFATMILGDLGAEVVKIERPGRGDDTRHWGPPFVGDVATYFLAINRNKRSLALDLKRVRGREVVNRLLRDADVVVSNFRAGLMEELGFGAHSLRERYPNLVVCTVTGHAEGDPRAAEPSFDLTIQAETGLMDLTGEADGPPTKVGVSIADEVSGLYLVQGIIAALFQRERTGRGALVNIPLNEALLSTFTYQAQQYLSGAGEPRRMGSEHPSLVPYRPYAAADRSFVVGVANEPQWERFCVAIGCEELAADPNYSTSADRVRNRGTLEALLTRRFASRPRTEWLARLREARVPCGPLSTVGEALEIERKMGTGFISEAPDGLPMLGSPIHFGVDPGVAATGGVHRAPIRRPAPGLGEHTEELLREAGYDDDEIAVLRADAVVD